MATPKGVFYEQLGKKLLAARRDQRLTQGRLAAAVDLSRTSVTNIEKGRQIVPVHLLAKLAQTLNVEIGALMPSLETVRPSARVERQISELEPNAREWAKRVLSLPNTRSEANTHAPSVRTRPKKSGGSLKRSKS